MAEIISAPPDPKFDKKFAWVAYTLLVLAIIFFTYLHHARPEVLRVPSNGDVPSWKSPAFENSYIYDRMTVAEREKVRAQGIPGNTPFFLIATELLSLLGAWWCFKHAQKYYGFWMASLFFIGSFIFTGIQESMMILTGRFGPVNVEHGLYGTYFFPKGILWFLETPVWVCLCWFLIAYSCVWVAGKVFPAMGLWPRAAVGGLIAMGIDLWEDPVLTSPEIMSWVWSRGDHIRILGIPHGNFIGWFLMISIFAILWEWLPGLARKWGRLKASLGFVAIVFAADICMYLSIVTWGTLSVFGIEALGYPDGIQIPPGW